MGEAYAKALIASGCKLPKEGMIFLSFREKDKYDAPRIGRKLHNLGYTLIATQGTYECLKKHNIPCQKVNKVLQGRPHIVDYIRNGKIQPMINTPSNQNQRSHKDDSSMRIAGLKFDLPCIINSKICPSFDPSFGMFAKVQLVHQISTRTASLINKPNLPVSFAKLFVICLVVKGLRRIGRFSYLSVCSLPEYPVINKMG